MSIIVVGNETVLIRALFANTMQNQSEIQMLTKSDLSLLLQSAAARCLRVVVDVRRKPQARGAGFPPKCIQWWQPTIANTQLDFQALQSQPTVATDILISNS